jgi:hypothetical protein
MLSGSGLDLAVMHLHLQRLVPDTLSVRLAITRRQSLIFRGRMHSDTDRLLIYPTRRSSGLSTTAHDRHCACPIYAASPSTKGLQRSV